ncbi:hypothetical protein [Nocardia anaemiae]|uniref:hypothetical protein n=1 Tax=Nocardia anaemiae TaxID=263910 RepID=UPI0012F4C7B6|nr:hypothetical protein [Nocardia anaemiae]
MDGAALAVLVIAMALLAGVPIVLLSVALPLALRAERQRKRALWQWAVQHGWSFAERSKALWVARLPGGGRRALGVTLSGMMGGRLVTVAEHSYTTTTSSGGSTRTQTHHYVAVVVVLDRPLPSVAVISRGAMSKVGRVLFGDRPTATGNEAFDARFRIRSADPSFARWLVGKPLMDAHLAAAVPDWSLVGQDLLTYRLGQLHHPHAIPGLVAPLARVADLLGR